MRIRNTTVAFLVLALIFSASCTHSGLHGASYQLSSAPNPADLKQNLQFNTEQYDLIVENEFRNPKRNPLSTFSIDVDTASYANARRFINQGQEPPKDAIRLEEFINYFSYDYPKPTDEKPFSVVHEVAECPWNTDHKLVHIGIQGKGMPELESPASNLVFLLDVSGSMNVPRKLPLLKKAFKLMVNNLGEEDTVSIVVYASATGLVLEPTRASNKEKILEALDTLSAGGGTSGGEGIELAYKIAQENFIPEGNNRIILATDGDFNLGVTSDGDLVRLIEEKREEGVFLTVLGFGTGNYKDSRMEKLADHGNGNYAYIDTLLEARKVLVNEIGSTLFTIAKDVKIQVEFNPTKVKSYRLIGYENRVLNDEDFNDDKKDAGELGAEHSVTALYEIVPVGAKATNKNRTVDPLKYQTTKVNPSANASDELLTLKLRYKEPKGSKSKLIVETVSDSDQEFAESSENFRFAAAVAEFGLLLRDSKFKGEASYEQVQSIAQDSLGSDKHGYRAEFLRLVDLSSLM